MLANSPRITYVPRPDATPETEAAALGAIYRLLLDKHAKKEAARSSGASDFGTSTIKGGQRGK